MSYKILKTEKEIISRLRERITPASNKIICGFNSHLNAFVTDPVFLSVPFEDKIIHRGYAVFETTKLINQKIYQLDKHLDRFMLSIEKINLKSKYSYNEFRDILNQLSLICREIEPEEEIEVRFFYSAGLGNFSVYVNDDLNTFYAIALKSIISVPLDGINEFTVSVSNLKEKVKGSKNTNYLINAMVTKESRDKGGFLGVMCDEEGFILESPISNIGFVINDEFWVPPFEKTLRGTTVLKIMEIIEQKLIPKGIIKRIVRDYVNRSEFLNELNSEEKAQLNIQEAMLIGFDTLIPILNLDKRAISESPGNITRILQELLAEDKLNHYKF